MTGPRLLRCGEHAVLVECDGLEQVLALAEAVRAAVAAGEPGFTDVIDVVPAATTVLVMVGDGASVTSLRPALARLAATASAAAGPRSGGGDAETVEIGVHYDGPDLDEVAAMTGLTREEVIEAHTATSWYAAFGGFAPGFAYLVGGDSRLQVPRRSEPRTSVPAGSVGLAGEFSAVYPRSSPGGWQLIGHTDAVMWDLERDPPALLQPGTLGALRRAEAMSRALEVLATGPLTLIQDLGRPGLAALGVGRSGAADRGAFRLGARLLAQDYTAAALEVTFGGLAVRAQGDLMVALTGAEAPATVDGHSVAYRSPLPLRDGETLKHRHSCRWGCARTSRCAAGSTSRPFSVPGRPTRCRASGRRRSRPAICCRSARRRVSSRLSTTRRRRFPRPGRWCCTR